MSVEKPTYPRHYEMKQARLRRLRKANYRCEWPGCEEEAYIIHHLDGSIDNHSEENLQVLCQSHHMKIHGIVTRSLHWDSAVDLNRFFFVLRERGWSIFRLSKAAGLSPPTVGKALKGNGTSKTYRKLAEVLGMDFNMTVRGCDRGPDGAPEVFQKGIISPWKKLEKTS